MQNDHKPATEPSMAPTVREPYPPNRTETAESAQRELKKGIKAVSFLSKFMGGSKKKDADNAPAEEESVHGDDRLEGTEATVFTEPVDNIGFSPRHPQPPAYIRVRSRNKQKREFDRLFLAQELECRKRRKLERQPSSNKLRRKSSAAPEAPNTVWAMEFSKDGKHLAAAGTDMVVRVWKVIASLDDRRKHETQESSGPGDNGSDVHAEHLSAPVFQSQPVREYEGHTSTVLDLSWSKNNFLLSSSMDKSVRLWHVSRPECLCTFQHHDFVPSISFHPKDDRFFLAGSLDSKLRLWSIPDKSVAYAANVPEMVTAVAFTPDGKYAVAGCFNGLCMFFETEGLKYQSQMHVRSSRGQNAKGSKITGIQTAYSAGGDTKLLITSNDSRVRLYNFRDKSLELKLKGNENNSSQIRACLSDCSRYITCGSEDRRAYIWSMDSAEGDKREKRPMEVFEAHNSIVTAVCMAPATTRHLLAKSEDPVYDLCNPPPVTLMSRAERAGSQSSSRPPTESGSAMATPADPDAKFDKSQPSPSFFARSGHKDGNIIVTADYTGRIKVFRQDCAWSKRRSDDWERSSLFSKRAPKTSRPTSLATRASQRSLRDGRSSTSTQPPGERIMTWRQGVASTSAVANIGRRSSSKHTSRSVSPSKSLDLRAKTPGRDGNSRSALSHAETDAAASSQQEGKPRTRSTGGISTGLSNLVEHNVDNPLAIHGGQSYTFWDTEQWKERAHQLHKLHEANGTLHPLTPVRSAEEGEDETPAAGSERHQANGRLAVRPHLSSGNGSYVSRLSDERSTSDDEGDFDDAREGFESEAERNTR